jgi:fermentation-respiration switch protein FrsA (DUF1100 family)
VVFSENSQKCALLLHGVRSDRRSMIQRAKFLKGIGLTSLLIDMQAHGETPGQEISFGHLEAKDAENGMEYLKRKLGCEKILVIGQSLGGAAALLGTVASKADALILESVFPTIEEAVKNRLEVKLGPFGRLIAPLLYLQIPLRVNVPLAELRPIEGLKKLSTPVFIIGGEADLSTKVEETVRMYNVTTSEKKLWVVNGAAHQDIHKYAKQEYEILVGAFINKVL